MEHIFRAKILAFSREEADEPTTILDIYVHDAEREGTAADILSKGPVTAEDKSFTWSEEACLVGLSIWTGEITTFEDGSFEFDGKWNAPTISELKELGNVL